MSDEGTQTRLLRFMQEIAPPAAPTLEPDTAIFATGLFDSLALVQLVLWVEETIGAPIDPTTLDLRREWATVADLAGFIATGHVLILKCDRRGAVSADSGGDR